MVPVRQTGGGRGAGWVWGQFAVLGVVIGLGFVPPHWPHAAHGALSAVGGVLAVVGGVVAVWSSRLLGRGFTPYPKPLPAGELVEAGPYRVVRHPVYGGGLPSSSDTRSTRAFRPSPRRAGSASCGR